MKSFLREERVKPNNHKKLIDAHIDLLDCHNNGYKNASYKYKLDSAFII